MREVRDGPDAAREQARAAAAEALAELRRLRQQLAQPRAPAAERDGSAWAARRLQHRLSAASPRAVAPAAELGPLNTEALVPRLLQRLLQLSPAYLTQLVTQLDALAVLPEPEAAPRRTARARRG